MDERQIRLACLQLANHPDKSSKQILDEALAMYNFVIGK